MFEPYFPWYVPQVQQCDAVAKVVTLQPPTYALPEAETRAAFSDKTRCVIFNTPHNPTGHVATRSELELIAELCIKHDVVAISDEVSGGWTLGLNGKDSPCC